MTATEGYRDIDAWREIFQTEIERAERARQAGNEGMARVCARRAAGSAVEAYLKLHDYPNIGYSAYDYLRYFISLADIDPMVRDVAQHFILRITPEHQLPIQADLISEAKWLAGTLHENL
jgi:hypothetical protein